jgi:site-specific DNA recombinase
MRVRRTPGERKAAIETFVAEIRITDEGVIPVFRIPGPYTPIPDTGDRGGADEVTRTAEPVRAMARSVELRGLEPLTPCMPCKCSTS